MVGRKSRNKDLTQTGRHSLSASRASHGWRVTGCKNLSSASVQSTGFTWLIIKLDAHWPWVSSTCGILPRDWPRCLSIIGSLTPHSVTWRRTGTWRSGAEVFHDSQGYWLISFWLGSTKQHYGTHIKYDRRREVIAPSVSMGDGTSDFAAAFAVVSWNC